MVCNTDDIDEAMAKAVDKEWDAEYEALEAIGEHDEKNVLGRKYETICPTKEENLILHV